MIDHLLKFCPKLILAALVVSSLFACTKAPSVPPSVGQEPLVAIAEIEPGGVFAANGNGEQVALTDDGLLLLETAGQTRTRLSNDRPVALAWDSSGRNLAAVFPEGDNRSRVRVYSDYGDLNYEVEVPVAYLGLNWSTRGDLLLAGYALKRYSFGSNLSQTLYIISADEQIPLLLWDTTIKPSTTRAVVDNLPELLPVVFMPQGDELVFLRLHDPPEFPPYLKGVHRNWQVPEEQLLGRIALKPVRLSFDPAQEKVNLLTPKGQPLVTYPLWGEQEEGMEGFDEKALEYSPSGLYRFGSGALAEGTKILVQWPDDARLQFLDNGWFLVEVDGQLFLGDGLKSEDRPDYREQEWVLRRWLHHGLITHDEYLRQVKELN